MGTVSATIEVGSPQGQNFRKVELVVDTGSTFTALPRETLKELGIPIDTSVPSELADGSQQTLELGQTAIRLGGR